MKKRLEALAANIEEQLQTMHPANVPASVVEAAGLSPRQFKEWLLLREIPLYGYPTIKRDGFAVYYTPVAEDRWRP